MKDINVRISQFSVPKAVHVLNVEGQLVVDHVTSVFLISTLRLQSKNLEGEKVRKRNCLQHVSHDSQDEFQPLDQYLLIIIFLWHDYYEILDNRKGISVSPAGRAAHSLLLDWSSSGLQHQN